MPSDDHSRLAIAVEATSLGIWEWTIETGEVYWSERQREIFALSQDEAASYEVWVSRLHPEDSSWVQAAAEHMLNPASGGSMHVHHRLLLPSALAITHSEHAVSNGLSGYGLSTHR